MKDAGGGWRLLKVGYGGASQGQHGIVLATFTPQTAALLSAPLCVVLAFTAGSAHVLFYLCVVSGVIIFFFRLGIPSAIVIQMINSKG